MAKIIIEIDRGLLTNALTMSIKSLQREKAKARGPKFDELLDSDINKLQTALNTMTESK